jgi:hypothetical protein
MQSGRGPNGTSGLQAIWDREGACALTQISQGAVFSKAQLIVSKQNRRGKAADLAVKNVQMQTWVSVAVHVPW